MQFSPDDLLSMNIIKTDVLVEVDDEEEKVFTPGWYTSQIQQATEELSFDTFFHTLYLDFNLPESLRLKIPSGAFNVKKIFLWSGDDCTVDSQMNVYIKDTYYRMGTNSGYTAMNRPNIEDPFIAGHTLGDSIYFASLQNGYIHFGEACSGYDKVRIYFNGVLNNIGDVPFIPRQFRQAVKKWVVLQVYSSLKSRDPKVYRPLYVDTYNELYAPFDGIWDKAAYRAKCLDSKYREDLGEYLSKGNW